MSRASGRNGARGRKNIFVSYDNVSSIYNCLAEILWNQPNWTEVSADELKGWSSNRRSIRDCDVILAQCHGKGAPWREIGVGRKVQVINYLRGSKFVTLKAELAMVLREWFQTHSEEEPFTPLTYVLYPRKIPYGNIRGKGRPYRGVSSPVKAGDEREAFLFEAELRDQEGVGNVWVAKTNHGSKGSGVQVLEGGEEVVDFIDVELAGTGCPVAVQKYVEDPLLIHGYKFDMRVWVVVDMEYGIFLYKEGVLRLSSHPYDPDNLYDHFSHLTNHCIQVHSSNYECLVEGNEMFFHDFRNYLTKYHPEVDLELDLLSQVRRQIYCTFQAIWGNLRSLNKFGGFQLYGFDFMIDSDYRVWLIEVNGAPAAADRLKEQIAEDIIGLCIRPRFDPPQSRTDETRRIPHAFEHVVSTNVLDRYA